MYDAAQKQRPRAIGTVSRIAPQGEPGTPMIIRGKLLQRDGKSAAANVIVFAYQTDATGVYHRNGQQGWRLKGWARTDASGRFELHTIRPGSYPGTRNPSHIHLHAEGTKLPRRWLPELQFADDPFVQSRRAGVRPVVTRGGVQHVDLTLTISDDGRF
jgi:protocatechuate 3,4-dioxygenase beta subunit